MEACRVARFSLGRAILWRPELVGSAPTTIAVPPPGVSTISPAAVPAAGASNRLPQQILDYMSRRSIAEIPVRTLRSCGSFGSTDTDQLRAACDALVDAGQGRWLDTRKAVFGLVDVGLGMEGGSR